MSDSNLPDKILFVDDDPSVAGAVKGGLGRQNVKIVTAVDLQSALYLYNQTRFDVVCIEMDFEQQPGLVLCQKWRSHENEERRCVGIIMLSGNRGEHDPGQVRLMSELRDIEVIKKPCTAIQLLPMLAKARNAKIRATKLQEIRNAALKLGEKEEKLEKALGMVQKKLPELGPRGVELMVELYEMHNKFDAALSLINPMLAKDPNSVPLMTKKGQILLKMGQNEEALPFLQKADAIAPNQLARMGDLAQAFLKNNQPDQAVSTMKQLIGFNPENPDMKFDMFAQLQQHGFDSHARQLCKSTTTPIEIVRYYNNKGVALKNAGNIEGALSEYERSLQYYPEFKENYRIHYNIALAHASFKNQKSYEIALDSLTKCLKLEPSFEKAKAMQQRIAGVLNGKKKAPPPKAS